MSFSASWARATLALASVFVAGALVGAFFVHQMRGGRGGRISAAEYRIQLLDALTTDLLLDESQREQVVAILDDTGQRFDSVREALEPEFEAIRQERAERILACLDQDQRAKYERLLEERRARREGGRGGGHQR